MQQHFSVCKFSCSVSMFGMNCLIGLSSTVRQTCLLSKAVSKATFSSSISRSVPWYCATLSSFKSSLKSYLFFQHFSQCALVLYNPFFFQKQSQNLPFLPAAFLAVCFGTVQPFLLSKAVSKATFSSSGISRSVLWYCATLSSFKSSLKSYLFFQHFSQCALVLCNPFFFQKQSQNRPFLPAFLAVYRLLSLCLGDQLPCSLHKQY